MSTTDVIPGAPQVPYYFPEQPAALGLAHEPQPDDNPIPKLYQPLTIKGLTFPNRVGVSPMCQYSSDDDNQVTPFHFAHYSGFTTRGAGLTIVEATSVTHEGLTSQRDLGLYTDQQAKLLKPIVDYAHANKANIGIQLGHGGRKSSTQPLYIHLEQSLDDSIGGWTDEIVAPSPIEYRPHGNYVVPKELSVSQIKELVKKFGEAAARAIDISGFDFIEIHGAHGYLINEFLSSVSNKRTDEYGGSFENRIRFLLEIIDAIRANIDNDRVPLFLRISAVENAPSDNETWTIEDSIKLAHIVADRGVDVLDVSSGGNSHNQVRRGRKEFVHLDFAEAIKNSVKDKLLIACVGNIRDADKANAYAEEGKYDFALIGKGFLQNPGLAWTWADQLGVRVNQSLQYDWGFHPNIKQIIELIDRSKGEDD